MVVLLKLDSNEYGLLHFIYQIVLIIYWSEKNIYIQ